MKRNIRKQAVLAVAAAFALSAFMPTLSAAPFASGDSVTITAGARSGPGGEFILTYASGSFVSFCVETNEYIGLPGGPYIATFNSVAVNGGSGFAGTYTGDATGAAGTDPLSDATAWLYSSYVSGGAGLTGWGSLTAVQRADTAQAAIWFLENEGGANNTWAQDAINAVTINGYVNPTGNGHVYVLNLTDQAGNHQDQLYTAPYITTTNVPEPETYAMLLAGLGLMGFVARRRKLKLATA